MQFSNGMRCAQALATALMVMQGAHAAEPMVATTRQEEFVRVYHGIPVRDPYAWLEDGNDPDVKAWSNAQNEAARAYLDNLPEWSPVARRLTELAKRKAKTSPISSIPAVIDSSFSSTERAAEPGSMRYRRY